MWTLKKKKQITSLGIDIGSKAIKIVELVKEKDRINLQNYGEIKLSAAKKESFHYFDKKSLLPYSKNVSLAIKAVLEESQIETKEAVLSLPDFSTFFASFVLPPMTAKELPDAVNFEAKKHIPIPFNDVVLDWELIGEKVNEKEGENKIIVMAIYKNLISEYKKIAEDCGLVLVSLEAEVMGLKRSIVGDDKDTICLVEAGYQSTTISIIDQGFLLLSVSFDVAGKDYTYSISEALNVALDEAEKKKMILGFACKDKKVVEAMDPIFNIILDKIKQVISESEIKNPKVKKIILVGGLANMPGLTERLKASLGELEVKRGDAFSDIFYPGELKPLIPQISSTFSIALGEALKRFKK